jgi:hypothetical protein
MHLVLLSKLTIGLICEDTFLHRRAQGRGEDVRVGGGENDWETGGLGD